MYIAPSAEVQNHVISSILTLRTLVISVLIARHPNCTGGPIAVEILTSQCSRRASGAGIVALAASSTRP